MANEPVTRQFGAIKNSWLLAKLHRGGVPRNDLTHVASWLK
jgi:hypothetical protein